MRRELSESMALYEIARRLGTPDEVQACKLEHRRRVVQSKARKERRGSKPLSGTEAASGSVYARKDGST